MKLSGEDLQKAISEATNGLLYPSESDYPVEPHVLPGAGATRLKKGAFPPGLCPEGETCVVGDVGRFFAPVTEIRDWYGPDETNRAERFKALLALLRKNLSAVKVYKVGRVTVQAYVLGRTADGDLAGVRTTLVES
jgi:hypothetical protein